MKVLIRVKALLEGSTINLCPVAFKLLITKHSEHTQAQFQILHYVIKLAAALGVHSMHQLVQLHADLVKKILHLTSSPPACRI
jgi:hypothetical protein